MVYLIILAGITLIGLVIATITDLKTREVPDWINYGLIAAGLSLNALFSIIYWDYWFFVNSLVGFLLFLMFALIMFYAGQWGGGDSKLFMALGALIGFDVRFKEFPILISFFINVLLAGAFYGLLWSIVLVFKNIKKFWKEARAISRHYKLIKYRVYLIIIVAFLFALAFLIKDILIRFTLLGFIGMTIGIFYLMIFVKAVEKSCMLKYITPDRLTEGDWIAKDISYKGKYICGPKDLGIEKRQIRKLLELYKQHKISKVLIKEGIPFVPSFLIAYIITLWIGNVFFLFI